MSNFNPVVKSNWNGFRTRCGSNNISENNELHVLYSKMDDFLYCFEYLNKLNSPFPFSLCLCKDYPLETFTADVDNYILFINSVHTSEEALPNLIIFKVGTSCFQNLQKYSFPIVSTGGSPFQPMFSIEVFTKYGLEVTYSACICILIKLDWNKRTNWSRPDPRPLVNEN